MRFQIAIEAMQRYKTKNAMGDHLPDHDAGDVQFAIGLEE